MAALLEPILNQILQAEMINHLGAGPEERTDERQGYSNGNYRWKLTTRVGTLELKVPRDREGEFQTALLDRSQRSEKALVLALMQYGSPGRFHAPREGDHHRALRTRVQ
jgi:transposase-like protein